MVDYLKIKESVEKDNVIMSELSKIYTDQDYLTLFHVLDRNLKCALISIKILTDGMEKVAEKIDSNDNISLEEKMKSTLLISDLINQIQETVIAIDECDAIKESWEYTGDPADDLQIIKSGKLK